MNEPQKAVEADNPVLNVISSVDTYFSQSNAWLGNPNAKGHCADALKGNKNAAMVLVAVKILLRILMISLFLGTYAIVAEKVILDTGGSKYMGEAAVAAV